MKTAIAFAVAATLIGATAAEARSHRKPTGASKPKPDAEVAATSSYAMAGDALVGVARFYVGTNPTELTALWCGRFMRLVVRRATGRDPGEAFDAAMSFARIGHAGPPGAGAIVVWSRGGGKGHVGIIARITGHSRAVVISGNDGQKGARTVMERERSLAGATFRYL